MNTPQHLLHVLHELKVRLFVEGGQLQVDAPRGSLTPELLSELRAHKNALVNLLQESGQHRVLKQISPVSREQPLPLSFAQERLWFLEQLTGPSAVYNMPVAMRLVGPLDVQGLRHALEAVVARHEVLRTRIETVEGQPKQVIDAAARVELSVLDLSSLTELERRARVEQWAHEEATRPFLLDREPVLRARLLRMAAEEHVFLLTLHHIAADGWSMAILIQELRTFYTAWRSGLPAVLPALPVQYADYAAWQRQELSEQQVEEQMSFWRGYLEGAPVLMELPLDHPRPARQRHHGAHLSFMLDTHVVKALENLGRATDTTLFMVLQAMFAAWLSRYTGQDDLLIGTSLSNRVLVDTEPLIGFFINTLPLRTRLSADTTFRDLLDHVRHSSRDVFEHQGLPFEVLVERLKPERSLSYQPLVQVMLVLQNAPPPPPPLPELSFSRLERQFAASKFDLELSLQPTPGGLEGTWTYNTDLFGAESLERWSGHFQGLVRTLLARPDEPVSQVEWLTPGERQRLLVEWNQTDQPLPPEPFLPWIVEARARETPDAVALVWGEQVLTYAWMEARSNQLAWHLKSVGVGTETLVGICLNRSPEFVIAILAILKAGGAYVPLDATHPPDRLAFIFQDAGMPVLITRGAIAGVLSASQVYRVDLDTLSLEARSTQPLPHELSAEDAAYVLYTSGSTGRPKGVVITHRGLVNMGWDNARATGARADSVVLQSASWSFDVSIYNVLTAFCAGARLVLMDEETHHSAEAIAALIRRQGVTHADFPPSLLAVLPEIAPPLLSSLTVGGEACPPGLAARWAPGRRFFNGYGPTECTVTATRAESPGTGDSVPIGRPVANVRVYLLDHHLQPVPVGVKGELYIGGIGLARGYHRQPELTRERFLSNPFGPGRLYKTGDLCRYRSDGQLEFLGRTDHQVKVRGFRIELGEIESVLGQYPGVADAAVLVREDEPGLKRLVAYVVADTALAVEELLGFLRTRLPQHMVPALVMRLEAFPLSSSGKVDRRALPRPEWTATSTYEAPRGPTEQVLADIWARVLRLERVGIHDNFFEIGGDSILSIQIVSRARAAGLDVSPSDLFAHQTVAELSRVTRPIAVRAVEQGLITGEVPLTPIQHWFFQQVDEERHHFNQGFMLELRPGVKPEGLREAFTAVVRHHDALRLRFRQEAMGVRQWHAPDAGGAEDTTFVLEVVDLSGTSPAARPAAIQEHATARQRSFELERGPLTRMTLFLQGEGGPAVLHWLVHHLVVDGVSWRVLLEDLETAYRQVEQGERVALPAKTVSFQEWARQLERQAGSEALSAELPFWRALAEAPLAPLPTDGSGEPPGASRTVVRALEAEETRRLLREAPAAYHTQINDLLLTALAGALTAWTGGSSLLIDLEGHGRNPLGGEGADLSRTVGWFTSLYPVGLKVEGAGVGERLKSIKEQLRAIPHQGLGYGVLRYLRRDPDLLRIPPASIGFNYLGQFNEPSAPTAEAGLIQGPSALSGGPLSSARHPRAHALELNSSVAAGRLRVSWNFDPALHAEATVSRLADAFLEALRELIAHCTSEGVGGYTPSDFPGTAGDQRALDFMLGEVSRVTGLARPPLEGLYPLSPSQLGMLLESQARPGMGLHVEQLVMGWSGPLDVAALGRALQGVVERHAILRTGFLWEGLEQPVQFALRTAPLPVHEEDWRGEDAEGRERRLADWLRADRERGFDMTRPPLMRLAVLRTGEAESLLVLSDHHILMDGWCLHVILGDTLALHQGETGGPPKELPPVRPYRDYLTWLRAQDLGRAEAYWREHLRGFRSPTPLMTRQPSLSAAPRFAEARESVSLEATQTLGELARQHRLTLNTLFLAAWSLVLGRHARREDLVLGTTVSGRPPAIPGVEGIVGLFTNTVPLRVRVPTTGDLLSWAGTLQGDSASRAPFEYCSGGQIHGWSEVPMDVRLFESVVVFESLPRNAGDADEAGPRVRPFAVRYQQASGARTHHALTLMVSPGPQLKVRAVYNAECFAPEHVQGLLRHLSAVCEHVARAPGTALASLRELAPEETLPETVSAEALRASRPEWVLTPPRTVFEQRLTALWREVLRRPHVGIHDGFFELGGHSLLAVALVARVRTEFGVHVPLAALLRYPTVATLAGFLESHREDTTGDWPTLIPLRTEGDAAPIFCHPGGGGNALYLYHLARYLGPMRPVYGLQPPGLDGVTPPLTTIPALAAHYLQEVRRIQPHGPYHLAGHSFGARVVYEMAQQLLRAGERVGLLAVLDNTPVYEGPEVVMPPDDVPWLLSLARAAEELVGRDGGPREEDFRRLPSEEWLPLLRRHLEAIEFLPTGTDPRQVRGFVQVFQTNGVAGRSYQPTSPIALPITLVCPEQLAAEGRNAKRDAWARLGPVTLHTVPGSHVGMMREPHVATLGGLLARMLEELPS